MVKYIRPRCWQIGQKQLCGNFRRAHLIHLPDMLVLYTYFSAAFSICCCYGRYGVFTPFIPASTTCHLLSVPDSRLRRVDSTPFNLIHPLCLSCELRLIPYHPPTRTESTPAHRNYCKTDTKRRSPMSLWIYDK